MPRGCAWGCVFQLVALVACFLVGVAVGVVDRALRS